MPFTKGTKLMMGHGVNVFDIVGATIGIGGFLYWQSKRRPTLNVYSDEWITKTVMDRVKWET
eukprot:UN21310